LYFNTGADKKEYHIPIEGIYLYYEKVIGTYLEDALFPETSSDIKKLLHNGQLIIIKNNKLYNILGHEITEKY
jgi:hypothetical protein